MLTRNRLLFVAGALGVLSLLPDNRPSPEEQAAIQKRKDAAITSILKHSEKSCQKQDISPETIDGPWGLELKRWREGKTVAEFYNTGWRSYLDNIFGYMQVENLEALEANATICLDPRLQIANYPTGFGGHAAMAWGHEDRAAISVVYMPAPAPVREALDSAGGKIRFDSFKPGMLYETKLGGGESMRTEWHEAERSNPASKSFIRNGVDLSAGHLRAEPR
jgi:hypothetical protein